MNQIKIGKFIAEMRKQRQFTQRELADALGSSVSGSAARPTGKRPWHPIIILVRRRSLCLPFLL